MTSAARGPGGFRPLRLTLLCAGLLVVLLAAGAAALSVGAAAVRPWSLLSGTLPADQAALAREIVLGLRLPRLLLAAIVGAALSASGVTFQAVLRNPLADPYVLGISGGAALGAILTAALGESATAGEAGGIVRPVAAFAGAVTTVFLLFLLARPGGRLSNTALLLTGVMVNAFFSAAILFVITVVDYARFQRVFFWLVGSIEPAPAGPIAATGIVVALGMAPMILMSGRMNLLSLGDEEARSLGVDPDQVKEILIIAASLVTAAAVSMTGLVGFVGLMVPHAIRALIGPDHRSLIPAAALGGAAFLVAADTAARTIMAPVEMPVGIVTALLGGPFFLWAFHRRAGWRSDLHP